MANLQSVVSVCLLATAATMATACSDATGVGGGEARTAALMLQPELPASFSPGIFDLAVDRVRVRLTRPPSEVVVDTLVFFPVNTNTLSVRLQVPLAGRREQFVAGLQLLSKSTLLFSGSTQVTVDEAGSTAPTVPLEYVGPGARVTTIRIAPRDTAIKPTDRFTFEVDAYEGSSPVSIFYVNWSTDDPGLAPVDAVGTLTAPDHRSAVTLRVISPNGVRDSTTIYFSPTAKRLKRVSGDNQSAVAGSGLSQALVVQALAADDVGVPGVRVRFQALSGGTPIDTIVITDAEGFAAATVGLGPVAGLQAYEASAPGLAAVGFTATAQIGPPARLEYLAGDNQTDTVTFALPRAFIARVTDAVGNPVAGVPVMWRVVSGGGSLDRLADSTNLNGITFTDYVLGTLPGPNIVRVSMANPASAVEFRAVAIPGGPASLNVLSGDNQVGTAGTLLESLLWVSVTDRWNNHLPDITVRWSEVQGGGQLSQGTTITDVLGRSFVTYRLPALPGPYNVVADVPGTPLTAVFSMQATAPGPD